MRERSSKRLPRRLLRLLLRRRRGTCPSRAGSGCGGSGWRGRGSCSARPRVGMPPHSRPSPPGGTVRCRSVVGASACWTDSHPSGPLVRDVGRASPLPSGLIREGCLPVGRDPSPPIDCAPVCGWPAKLQGGSAWNWCCGHGGIGSGLVPACRVTPTRESRSRPARGRKVGRSPPKAEPPALWCATRPRKAERHQKTGG